MKSRLFNVLLCIENKVIEAGLIDALSKNHCSLQISSSSYELLSRETQDTIIVLETSDDAARLTQVVYELYRKSIGDRIPIVVGLLSTRQMQLNPSASLWNIDGHAALAALVASDKPDSMVGIIALINRMLTYAE
jgi:hypothetical protein